VLGFLSVSTIVRELIDRLVDVFQSRAGFSECLDLKRVDTDVWTTSFQSRAGFSECLDQQYNTVVPTPRLCFNPVLGFLSVSTLRTQGRHRHRRSFNPVLGFLSVSTATDPTGNHRLPEFQSRAGFSECLDKR